MRVRRARDKSVTIDAQAAPALVLDFDGTVTEDDMLDRVCWEFGDQDVYREVDAALDRGEIRLVDDIGRKLVTVRSPLEEVVGWVRAEARVRPGFDELVRFARANDWRVVVLTSSFHELVEPVLGRLAGQVELVANRLDPRRDGWRAYFHDLRPCDVCGEPCKRGAVARLGAGDVVYVGDGFSDRCVAEDVELVFARDGLATYLDDRGVAYEGWDDFNDVLAVLEREELAA
jgi:2-hydroxy-3-keto-5-methylthiopentenyl-1-phosphate phosphatase